MATLEVLSVLSMILLFVLGVYWIVRLYYAHKRLNV